MSTFSWIVACFSLIATVGNIHKKRWPFVIWFFTNSAWTAIDIYYGVYAQAALQATYAGLAIYGVIKWK